MAASDCLLRGKLARMLALASLVVVLAAPVFPAQAASPSGKAAAVEPLKKIMNPPGFTPVGTKCTRALLFGLRAKTLKARIFCAKTTGRKIVVWGYQFDSRKDYLSGLGHINSFTGFSSLHPGGICPPGHGKAAGKVGWHANSNPKYKARAGQFIECFKDNGRPLLIWTMPTQHVFFISQDRASRATLRIIIDWWKTVNYG